MTIQTSLVSVQLQAIGYNLLSPASTSWCHLLSFFLNESSAWSAQVIIRAFHDFRDSSIYDIIQSDIKVTQKRRKLCLQKQRWYSIERKSMPINPRHCCNSFVNTKVPTVMEFLASMKYDLLKFPKIYKTHCYVCLFGKMVLNWVEKHAD